MVMCLVLFTAGAFFHTSSVAAHKMVCLKFEPACKSSISGPSFTQPFLTLNDLDNVDLMTLCDRVSRCDKFARAVPSSGVSRCDGMFPC